MHFIASYLLHSCLPARPPSTSYLTRMMLNYSGWNVVIDDVPLHAGMAWILLFVPCYHSSVYYLSLISPLQSDFRNLIICFSRCQLDDSMVKNITFGKSSLNFLDTSSRLRTREMLSAKHNRIREQRSKSKTETKNNRAIEFSRII